MTSDLLIPRLSDILDRALDSRESAVRLADDSTVRQIDRLVTNLSGSSLCWQLGTLLLRSPSGQQYRVTRGGCSCPNGQKCDKRQCWHVATFELLLDMFETACETADMEAECGPPDIPDEPQPPTEGGPEPEEWRHPVPHAAEAAAWVGGRQQLAQRLNATAQLLDAMRQAQQRPAEMEARRLGVRLVAARKRSSYFTSAFYLAA